MNNEILSKYNSKEVEERILEKWLKDSFFHASVKEGCKPFTIVIPPPNITGILHMGHALNNTLQDVLIRFRRMQGFSSLWMPGTDHAGIATQNVVEKSLAKEGLKKEDIGRDEFIKRLSDWKEKYGSTIIDQLKKLGASCDWERLRFTMDGEYSESVKEVFVRLYEKGLIYRGNYIINWCPRCKTALSDEESAHKEIDSWLYYIRYPVEEIKPGQSARKYIVVATTRPETMLGDTAIAVNPNDGRYRWLKDAKVILPFVERELTIIEDEGIDPAFGTGAVKVTPAHDPADFVLGKKFGLDFINIMNDDATLNNNVPDDFAGMDRFEARAALIALLEEKKLLEKKEPYKLSAGHCYRCHTIIEPRISLQWFVNMNPLAKEAIKVVEKEKIKFYPKRWTKVYLNWMNNIQDWCISRQIWWGHRIPVYYCQNCRKGADSPADIQGSPDWKNQTVNNKGVIVSKSAPEKCPDCGSSDISQDDDVLDTWFSSWLWPFATFYWPFESQDNKKTQQNSNDFKYFYPTDCLITASEILFFWVARMIMAGLEFTGQIPFKDVIIHGTVRDKNGIKMSKSLGNVIDPLEITDKFGADALRFSLMLLAATGSDIYLSDEKFLVGRNFSNKIWNAARFMLLKIRELDTQLDNLEFKAADSIDGWILQELNTSVEQTTGFLENYSFNEATKRIYDFFWHTFCDWYIEIIKDKFTLDNAKISIHILITSMKLLHPIMPFITEEITNLIKSHTRLTLDDSLAKSSWPKYREIEVNKDNISEINALIDTVREVRNIKANLGLGQKKVKMQVKAERRQEKLWQDNKTWIQRLTLTDDIIFTQNLTRVLYKNGLWEINLDMASADINDFLAALEKKIDNLKMVLDKAIQRLNNDKFIRKASKDIIENEKEKYKSVSKQLEYLTALKDAFN